METALILLLLLAILTVAVFFTLRHLRRGRGCCGGGSYRVKQKKLALAKYEKQFSVGGMHCEKCKARVEEIINDIKGVSGRVSLKTGILTVSYAEDVADDLICARITRAGYSIELRK